MNDEDRAAEDAHAFLRGHTTGDLRFDGQYGPLRYVIAPRGQLVAPVAFTMLQAVDTVLFVPENADGAMEIQVTLEELDPDGAEGGLSDRWRIYHGDPQEARWALFDIDAARYQRWVVDGAALMRPNPLAAREAALCRHVNQGHREALRSVCLSVAGADVEDPMLVGIDTLGLDVRRRFDVLRVPAPEPMTTADDAERILTRMLSEATPNG